MIHVKISYFSNDSRPSDDELAATVSFLDEYGKYMPGYKRFLLNFCCLIEYIYNHQKKQGRYIFSTTEKETTGSKFVNKINSSSLPSERNLHNQPIAQSNPYLLKSGKKLYHDNHIGPS